MAETKQPIVLALGRGYNGFFCPETRFHLVGVMKSQAVYTATSLSEDVKRALRGGTLVDVNRVLSDEDKAPGKNFIYNTTSGERKKTILIQADEAAKEKKAEDAANGNEADDYVAPNLSEQTGELLSESDIVSGTKKELLAFIEKTEDMELETLELNSRSNAEEIKDALLKHFGYSDKPVDVAKQADESTESNEE